MWKLGGDDDNIRLCRDPLPEEELNKVLLYLAGKDPNDPPEGWLLLYYHDDSEEVVTVIVGVKTGGSRVGGPQLCV